MNNPYRINDQPELSNKINVGLATIFVKFKQEDGIHKEIASKLEGRSESANAEYKANVFIKDCIKNKYFKINNPDKENEIWYILLRDIISIRTEIEDFYISEGQ